MKKVQRIWRNLCVQGRRLNIFWALDLQALGWHCIKNTQVSGMEITACAQEHFHKVLSVNNRLKFLLCKDDDKN